jgi:hypothetical protein
VSQSIQRSKKSVIGVGIALFLASACVGAHAAPAPAAPNRAARDAAMAELKPPSGVGGCVYRAVPATVRRATLERVVMGQSIRSPALESAVAQVAPRCTGRSYLASDVALIGAVSSAFQRAAAALYLATQVGVGQKRLDAAWENASPLQKEPFTAAARQYLDPDAKIAAASLNIGPLAAAAGIAPVPDKQVEMFLRIYFLSTALSEAAEAALHAQGTTSPP